MRYINTRLLLLLLSLPVIDPLHPTPFPMEITFIYNTVLNFIPVSFFTAYIFVTFRVRVRVRVSFRVRVRYR